MSIASQQNNDLQRRCTIHLQFTQGLSKIPESDFLGLSLGAVGYYSMGWIVW
jgi:hypothetical protein